MPRFRLRTLMLVVALIGTTIGITIEMKRCSERFRAIAARHASEISPFTMYYFFTPVNTDHLEWKQKLVEKYERSARYPWLPVAPDPPEPK